MQARWKEWVLTVMVMLALTVMVPVVHAATVPGGTEITIDEGENIGATIWHYLTVWGIRLGGIGLAANGLFRLGSQQREGNNSGIIRTGSGVGLQFVPSLITGASTNAPAATGLGLPVLDRFGQFLDGLFGSSLLVDPTFLMVAGIMFAIVAYQLRTQRTLPLARV